ncbi:MAG: methylated-DNA--[protein]-cysteine S-methyltransferase [Dorea sp.]
MEYVTDYESKLGKILLASDGKAITGLWFYGQKYFADTLGDKYENGNLKIFQETKKWLEKYFSGKNPEMNIELNPKGSEFRQKVWKILCEIPYGEVMTYGEIAKKIAKAEGKKSMSAQAVGGAVGHNPISILIPCHRVVGSDGSMTGYAGGVEKKEWMIGMEQDNQLLHFKNNS